ncbi:hypothetical protein [Staphylococcus epidermidis]|nr:hypothetical protein [Staphylococcus epidermidis]
MDLNGRVCDIGGIRRGGSEMGKSGDAIKNRNKILGGMFGKRKVK